MSRQVIYMAHPVAPTEGEISEIPYDTVECGRGEYEADIRHPIPEATRVKAALRANLERALRWLAWLRASFPETTFIAPWISVQSLNGDDSPALREAGLVDACAVIERCDGIALVGGRISSGMRREMEHGVALTMSGKGGHYGAFGHTPPSFIAYDLTHLGSEPPAKESGLAFTPRFVERFAVTFGGKR